MASWEIKNREFASALEGFEITLPGILEKNLGDVSKEHRDLMVCLVISAFECLRLAMQSGPDRLGAVKLVLQVSGLMKDQPKLPKVSKTPPGSEVSAPNSGESTQE